MNIEIDYSTFQISSIFAAYIVAALVKGVTGLGFSTICLPILALTIGLKDALPLVIIPSVSSNILVMVGAGHFVPTVMRFWPMLIATVPGIVLGLWFLSYIDGILAGAVLGMVLIVFSLLSYINPSFNLAPGLEGPLGPVSGFLTGLVNGVTGSQVMPSLPFLMALPLSRNAFIQAINCSFTLSSIVMAFGLAKLGLMTPQAALLSTFGILIAFAGVRTGENIRGKLSPQQFRKSVLITLGIMGAVLIAKAI